MNMLTNYDQQDLNATAALISRVTLGILMLAHSVYLKLIVFTLPGTAGYFESIGLPGFTAYLVFAGEAAAGLALIVGFQVRLAALALIPILLGATWAHAGNGWVFSNPNGGWEFPAFLVMIASVQVLLGGGKYALISDSAK